MNPTVKIHVDHIIIPTIRATSRMDPDAQNFFKATIESVGVIQEPVVRPISKNKYELVAGLSRLQALINNGAKEVDVKVIETDERTATIMHLAENVARGKVDPISIAQVMSKLLLQGETNKDLAKKLGHSETWVKRTLSLLDLPDHIQEAIAQGKLTPSHVYIAARLTTPSEVLDGLQTAITLQWSSTVLETYVSNRLEQIEMAKQQADEQGQPTEIPKADPQKLVSFRQCLTCHYRKPAEQVTNQLVCEGCIKLIGYVTSQLGAPEEAIEKIYSAITRYHGQPATRSNPIEKSIEGSGSQ